MKQFLVLWCLLPLTVRAQQPSPPPQDPVEMFAQGMRNTSAIQVHESVHQAEGFGNTLMVTTSEGNVIIDTSMPFNAKRHKELLQSVSDAPTKYIILTHAHGDHRSGVPVWREEGTEVIAHKNFVEMRNYQDRLAGFFTLRNNAQFQGQTLKRKSRGNFAADIEANIFVNDSMILEVGDKTFHIYHAPGETYDHLAIWMPKEKIAFVGDNFYRSFPNIYTLRGTKPRWALDYVQSLDMIMSWEPEIIVPSHGPAVNGKETVKAALTQYRDAILYVHDATVNGMNDGKDVFTLMKEIQLPKHLIIGDTYGNIPWTVRGIYEGYAGWFNGETLSLYAQSPSDIYPDVVDLLGGSAPLLQRAQEKFNVGQKVGGLHLVEIALSAKGDHEEALKLKIDILQSLLNATHNTNERGWLRHGINETQKLLEK